MQKGLALQLVTHLYVLDPWLGPREACATLGAYPAVRYWPCRVHLTAKSTIINGDGPGIPAPTTPRTKKQKRLYLAQLYTNASILLFARSSHHYKPCIKHAAH